MLAKIAAFLRNLIPTDNSNPMMVILAIVMALFVLGLIAHKRAWGAEPTLVTPSWGSTVIRGTAPVFDFSVRMPTGHAEDAWNLETTLIGHSTFDGRTYPNNYIFSGEYITGLGPVDVGFGPSWMINPGPYNGTNVNIHLSLGFHWRHLELQYLHWSCGGACSPNYGRDAVVLGWEF